MASASPATTPETVRTSGTSRWNGPRDLASALAGVVAAVLWVGAVGLVIWATTSAAVWLLVNLGVTR